MLTVILSFLFVCSLPQQSTPAQGTIIGSIRDVRTRAPINAARIIIEGTRIATRSSSNGSYALKDIPAGKHNLTFIKAGYQAEYRTNIMVLKDSVLHVDVYMVQSISDSLALRRSVDDGMPLLLKRLELKK
jgi:hypothetical protein